MKMTKGDRTMKRVDFNRNWTCRCLTREGEALHVTLPHDAMISEPRSNDSVAEGNIGWYIGGDYEYVKRFDAPEEWQTKTLLLVTPRCSSTGRRLVIAPTAIPTST